MDGSDVLSLSQTHWRQYCVSSTAIPCSLSKGITKWTSAKYADGLPFPVQKKKKKVVKYCWERLGCFYLKSALVHPKVSAFAHYL